MLWQDVVSRAALEGVSSRIVAMEVIQLHLLNAIYSRTDSTALSFQGGTCLRLVYGGHRYSEDLDFVNLSLLPEALDRLVQLSAKAAGNQLAAVLGLGEGTLDPMKTSGSLMTWWFRYKRQGVREVLRVKLEVGRYPAHEVTTEATRSPSLPFLPPALVRACSLRELLADKINALAQRQYVKGRDLYDIWFLRTLGIPPDLELTRTKFRDYGTNRPLERLRERLDRVTSGDIKTEMERFLPTAIRQHLEASDYLEVLAAVRKTVGEVLA